MSQWHMTGNATVLLLRCVAGAARLLEHAGDELALALALGSTTASGTLFWPSFCKWQLWPGPIGCTSESLYYRTRFDKVVCVLQGNVSSIQMVMASALVVGCATASVTLWYFSRRYVGELSLLKGSTGQPSRLCFSVLDFWGNREVRTRLLVSAYTKTTCLHSVPCHVAAVMDNG